MFKMTVDVIERHAIEDQVVAFVSDTCSTMKSLWQKLKERYQS